MYNVLDIADYVIFHEHSQHRTVSNLRLQKLLYFIQAQFLVSIDRPCFNEPIEAWDFGPVVPEVYHQYKIFGSSVIPNLYCNPPSSEIRITDRNIIDEILDDCAKYSTTQLVSITHHQRPWKDAYSNPYTKRISCDAIKSYFKD